MNGWDQFSLLLWFASFICAVLPYYQPTNNYRRGLRMTAIFCLGISALIFARNLPDSIIIGTLILALILRHVNLKSESYQSAKLIIGAIFVILNIENLVNVIVKFS
jgi:hypothetical protein